jgi:hypothetical protein
MSKLARTLRKLGSAKLVAGFLVTALVAIAGATSHAAAAPNYFDVAKGSPQKVCYSQYGGKGWEALGFTNLDHCLRYVATASPNERADCGHGYWYVYGFNSFDECVQWVVAHGGVGYGGDPNEEY